MAHVGSFQSPPPSGPPTDEERILKMAKAMAKADGYDDFDDDEAWKARWVMGNPDERQLPTADDYLNTARRMLASLVALGVVRPGAR